MAAFLHGTSALTLYTSKSEIHFCFACSFFFFLLLPDVGSRKKKLDRRLPRERPVEYRDRFPDLRPTIYSRK